MVVKEKIADTRIAAALLLLFLLLVLATMVPRQAVVNAMRDAPTQVATIALGLFVGLGYIILRIIRLRKFGRSYLCLRGEPSPGGQLAASLKARLDPDIPEPLGFTLELAGYESKYIWSRGRRESVRRVLWRTGREIPPEQWCKGEGGMMEVPVCLDIPASLPRGVHADTDVRWEATAIRDVPGADFKAGFRIPMDLPQLVSLDDH